MMNHKKKIITESNSPVIPEQETTKYNPLPIPEVNPPPISEQKTPKKKKRKTSNKKSGFLKLIDEEVENHCKEEKLNIKDPRVRGKMRIKVMKILQTKSDLIQGGLLSLKEDVLDEAIVRSEICLGLMN